MKNKKKKSESEMTNENIKGWKGRELIVYEDFVRFTALPRGIRQKEYGFEDDQSWRFKAKEKFSRKCDVSQTTIARWKNHKEFWNDVRVKMHEWAKDFTPSVIGSLMRTAVREGKAAEVKLWMQIFEDFTEKESMTASVKLENEQDFNSKISDEEQAALIVLRNARKKRIDQQIKEEYDRDKNKN